MTRQHIKVHLHVYSLISQAKSNKTLDKIQFDSLVFMLLSLSSSYRFPLSCFNLWFLIYSLISVSQYDIIWCAKAPLRLNVIKIYCNYFRMGKLYSPYHCLVTPFQRWRNKITVIDQNHSNFTTHSSQRRTISMWTSNQRKHSRCLCLLFIFA